MMRRVCHITSVKYAKDTRQVPGFQVDAPMPRSFFQMHDVCLACLFALLLDTNGTWPCPLALCLTCLIAFLLSTNGVGHAPWHYALPLCTVPGHRLGWAIFALHCAWQVSFCIALGHLSFAIARHVPRNMFLFDFSFVSNKGPHDKPT